MALPPFSSLLRLLWRSLGRSCRCGGSSRAEQWHSEWTRPELWRWAHVGSKLRNSSFIPLIKRLKYQTMHKTEAAKFTQWIFQGTGLNPAVTCLFISCFSDNDDKTRVKCLSLCQQWQNPQNLLQCKISWTNFTFTDLVYMYLHLIQTSYISQKTSKTNPNDEA